MSLWQRQETIEWNYLTSIDSRKAGDDFSEPTCAIFGTDNGSAGIVTLLFRKCDAIATCRLGG